MDVAAAGTSLLGTALPVVVLRVAFVLAIAAIATVMSMRLLGTRRGWTTALLAAVVGWGIAGLTALGLSSWDWGADGLVVHLVAIGIPATMAVAVALDLLAPPGTLATGERAGLVVIPRPMSAVRNKASVLRRYRELARLARREGFGPFLSARDRAERSVDDPGIRLRRVLEEAGGVYIKMGQIAATRVDLLPPEVCEELAGLQNRVAPAPADQIRQVLEAELGDGIDRVFAEFDWEPLAAASIGQTYRARLHSGEPVVVKVQRPGVDAIIERDLAALSILAGVAQRRTIVGQGVRSGEVLEHFAVSLRAELDFLREADAMAEMAMLLDGHTAVRIPRVHRKLCTRRLLVQERFEGFTMADADQLRTARVDRTVLAEQLLQASLEQVLRLGFFHADPHPGNIFVFDDGTLGLIDFGAVGRLDSIEQAAILDMLGGFVTHDVRLLRDAVERVADIDASVSPDQIERALARLLADNVRPTGAVDPSVLQDLVHLLSQYGVRVPGDLVLLSRALVTLDGTLRVLAPDFSLVSAATELMTGRTGPGAVDGEQMVRDELLSALPRLRHLPDRLDRLLMLAGRGHLRLRSVVDEDSRRLVRTFVNRALLTAIGAVFLVAAVLLLVAADEGPQVSTDTGLFEVLGYGGLLAGTVLLLRVATSVARDGTT